MKLINIFLLSLILLPINACQMRSSGTQSSGSTTDGTTATGTTTGTTTGTGSDTYNYTTTDDGGALYLACMLYEEQKKRDAWFDSHELFNSCGYTDETYTIGNENYTFTETINGCTDEYAQTTSSASTCQNYGDPAQATYTQLKISLKFNLMHKVMIVIQNGVISLQPYYGWYSGVQFAPTIQPGTILNLPTITAAVGFAIVQEGHVVGGVPGAENSCDDVEGDFKAHEAKVTINGIEYNWNWIGFIPFKIPEFQNQYTYSTDCIQNDSSDSSDTFTDIKGSTYNNFTYPTHIVYALNKKVDRVKNEGCRTVTINFDLGFYKTIESEAETLEYSNAELESQCAEVLSDPTAVVE